jgi:hypothetical protein
MQHREEKESSLRKITVDAAKAQPKIAQSECT